MSTFIHKLLMSDTLRDAALGIVVLEVVVAAIVALVIIAFVAHRIISACRLDSKANRDRNMTRVIEMGPFRSDFYRTRRF